MLYLVAVQVLGVFLSQLIENRTTWAWPGMLRVRFNFVFGGYEAGDKP